MLDTTLDITGTSSADAIQFLDGRPVAVYIAPDELLHTDRDEIAEVISDRRSAHRDAKNSTQQMDKLLIEVRKWSNQHKDIRALFKNTNRDITATL